MDFDRVNVATITTGVILALAFVFNLWGDVVDSGRILEVEQERTKRASVETCASVEDKSLRVLCIQGITQDKR